MRMRLMTIAVMAALLPGLASTAAAQTETPATAGSLTGTGSVDFGIRFTDVSGDAARFQRFRDLGDGAYVQAFRVGRSGPDWLLGATAENVGREDQRYRLNYKRGGRLNVSFVWDQIPLWMSDSTRTLYTGIGTGTLRLADGIQQSLQTSTTNLANLIDGAQRFDLRSRRDVAGLDVVFSPTRDVDLTFNLKNTVRQGTQVYGHYLGTQPVELPQPVDTRTTDIGTSLQWTKSAARLSVGYTGSWFDNRVPTLVWDNPWRVEDSETLGSSQGRMALWPDNTLQAVTASGAVKMAGRSNLTASLTLGRANQNETLLPFTINSQIGAPALTRSTADAQVRNTAMNITLTSRPHRWVWLSARWRYYDSDNKMPTFAGADYIRTDQRVSEFQEVISTAPLSFSRNNVDLDLSLTPHPFAAMRVAYSRNESTWENRIFSGAVEDVVRASVDTGGFGWLTFRGVVERSSRNGSGFREHLLEAFEEQPTMRHFDVADRDRTRVTGLVQVTPGSVFGASASISRGKDEYDDAQLGTGGFGLKSYENRRYSVSTDLTPNEQVSAGVWFVRENYAAFQRSRSASAAQFSDPQRDWMLDSDDNVDTLSAELELRKLGSKADVQFGYQTSRSTAHYLHSVVNSAVLPAPISFPPAKNTLDAATADVYWPVTDRVGVGVMYRFDRYRVQDFLLDESMLTGLVVRNGIFLGYVYRPYTANGVSLRLNYRW